MKENIFNVEAAKREREQADLQKKLNSEEPVFRRKVPMNITLPIEYKERLQKYARKKHLSASILIQTWIDKYCM